MYIVHGKLLPTQHSLLQKQKMEEERQAQAAEVSQLKGHIAELRHQLEMAHRKAEVGAQKWDHELAASASQLDRAKEEQRELSVRPPPKFPD
jgi:hypothetical protein